eukprot:6177446-Pleurochrysis_carterae.AAC.3
MRSRVGGIRLTFEFESHSSSSNLSNKTLIRVGIVRLPLPSARAVAGEATHRAKGAGGWQTTKGASYRWKERARASGQQKADLTGSAGRKLSSLTTRI